MKFDKFIIVWAIPLIMWGVGGIDVCLFYVSTMIFSTVIDND